MSAWFEVYVCCSGTKLSVCLNQSTTNLLSMFFHSCHCHMLKRLFFSPHSGEDSDVDSEVEDRVDGVKSWISKNKGSTKTLSDDVNLKTPRSVWFACFMSLK